MNKYQEALQNVKDTIVDVSELEFVPAKAFRWKNSKRKNQRSIVILSGTTAIYTTDEDLNNLQELVERATPKDVSWFTNQKGQVFDCCSKCKTKIKRLTNYCSHCGQAIKWED